MRAARAPTVRQQRLGDALRRLRGANELSAEAAGKALGWSASKVSRIETAQIGARISDVRLLLELYGADEHLRGELLALAHEAAKKAWWSDYPELHGELATFIALEDEADSVSYFANDVIPGLLQTEAYARHLITAVDTIEPIPPAMIRQRVEARLRRQQLIQPPRALPLSVILDEAVLLRRIGDRATMAGQLQRLSDLSRLPNITLRVLPLDADHGPGMSSFALLEYAPAYEVEFAPTVYTENINAASSVQDDSVAHLYRRAHQWLTAQSLDPEQSREEISRIISKDWSP